MSKRIVAILRPFEIKQQIYVYDGNNKIDALKADINNILDTLFQLSEHYEINKIILLGSRKFNNNIKEQLQEKELTKYSVNKLDIEII